MLESFNENVLYKKKFHEWWVDIRYIFNIIVMTYYHDKRLKAVSQACTEKYNFYTKDLYILYCEHYKRLSIILSTTRKIIF